ncbi:MAG: hypothetical protein Q7N50_11975 [Armatimonadota bacterium]|nr:hypothetical protein [Armatimonadota bacterium]
MKKFVVVVVLVAALCLCAAQAFADRIIFTPTGSLLDKGSIKAEAAFGPSDVVIDRFYWVNVGLGKLELEGMRRVEALTGEEHDIISAELGILPETLLTPALGVGVRDIGDEIERGYYAAVTKTVPVIDKIPFFSTDIKLHAGYGIDGFEGFFAGAEVGLPMKLRIAAEYDGDVTNAYLSWNGLPKTSLKVYSLDGDIFYGAGFHAGL